jgi:hypothetical protein
LQKCLKKCLKDGAVVNAKNPKFKNPQKPPTKYELKSLLKVEIETEK